MDGRIGWLVAAVAWVGLAFSPASAQPPTKPADKPKPPPADTNQLSLQVAALQSLYNFDFTDAQLEALARLAPETAEKPRARQPAKASTNVLNLMKALREALIAGDDDRIADLSEKLDQATEAEKTALDDTSDLTDPARKHADEVFKLLSVRQVAAYLANNPDAVDDPVELLMEALDQGRAMKGEDWKTFRQDTIEEIGILLGGLSGPGAKAFHAKVGGLLDKAHKLSDDDYKAQRADFDKDIQKLAHDVGTMKIVHNAVTRDLAELLSNPQLAAAVELRQKRPRP